MAPPVIDDNGDEWVTIADAAQRLRVRPSALYNWRSRGVIRGLRIGPVAYVNLTDAQAAEHAWRTRAAHRKDTTP